MLVLLVDDDENDIILQTRELQRHGFQVISAMNVSDGVRLARANSCDMIVCDLKFANASGYDLAREVKRDPSLHDIPIIALTGALPYESSAIDAGFDALIIKPLDATVLHEGIVKSLMRTTITLKQIMRSTRYDRFEVKCASFIVGATEILWGLVAAIPGPSQYYMTFNENDMGAAWAIIMIAIGIILSFGAIRPHRAARHIGLVLSIFLWLSLCSMFILDGAWTPSSVLMPVFAMSSLALLIQDRREKGERCAPERDS